MQSEVKTLVVQFKDSDPFTHLPPYEPPSKGLLAYLPASLVPFAQLMRIEKPAGWYTGLFPHIYGVLWAALLNETPPSFPKLTYVNICFVLWSVLIRGAACSWNDTIDAPYDKLVARCRHRPIARGAISSRTAHIFTIVLSTMAAAVLYQLPPLCIFYAVPYVTTAALYPFAKHVTNYPQLVLGFGLGVGQLIGAASVDVDPLLETRREIKVGMLCFYGANVLSAIIVDSVYSHQDVKDDKRVGLKSIAVAWEGRTRPLLWMLSVMKVGLLASAGACFGLGAVYFICTVAGTIIILGAMVYRVKLDSPESCAFWFQRTISLAGLSWILGLLMEYLLKSEIFKD